MLDAQSIADARAARNAAIQADKRAGMTTPELADKYKMTPGSVRKVLRGVYDRGGVPPAAASAPRLPDPAPEAGGPGLPEATHKPRTAFDATTPGWTLVLGDTHLPFHDRATIEGAVAEARDKRAAMVLLNGDILDMFGVSPFFRPPDRSRFVDEIDTGVQFLRWLRSRMPNARIIMREGNHEFRLRRYIADRAQALYDLPSVQLPVLLEMANVGVEWVDDKRKVMLGKLATLHGHELRKGEGVNPARFAFLRTTCTVLVNHFHRTSEHHQRSLDDKAFASWSVGCACYLSPDFDPYGQSNHGYAMVEVAADGWFSVHNRRVLGGRVV